MITIIAGTNRPDSKTRKVAEYCYSYLKTRYKYEVNFLSLESLPADILNQEMYTESGQSKALGEIQDSILVPAHKWLILSPEYNGGFAGILKLFLDAVSIRKYKETFKGKYVGLIGVSSGRAGNLRGLDQLTVNLNYLGMHIHPTRLPISSIGKSIVDGELNDETKSSVNLMLDGFVQTSVSVLQPTH